MAEGNPSDAGTAQGDAARLGSKAHAPDAEAQAQETTSGDTGPNEPGRNPNGNEKFEDAGTSIPLGSGNDHDASLATPSGPSLMTDDAGAQAASPALSPITEQAEALFEGPKQIDCTSSNNCEVGKCELDTSPCAGSFEVLTAQDLAALNGCTSVAGDLLLAAPDLSSLEPLQSLVSIGGNLTIEGCEALVNLSGLENLRSIAGDLSIRRRSVGGYTYNALLGSIEALSGLNFIGGDVFIEHNNSLETLDGFNVQRAAGSITLQYNDALSSVEALSTLTCVNTLYIEGSPQLTTLSGLENLEQVDSISLYQNRGLTDLSALSHLQWIPGSLYLAGNHSLTSLADFSGLLGVGTIGVSNNDQLTSFAGLDNLRVARQWVTGTMQDFTGLRALRVVGYTLEGASISTRGLDSLEAVAVFNLEGSVELVDLPPDLVIGELMLSSDAPMTDLSALDQASVTEAVIISGTQLRSLDGLHVAPSLLGTVALAYNAELTSVQALSGLRSVGKDLTLDNNPALTDLTGLDGVESVGGNLELGASAVQPGDGTVVFEALTDVAGRLHATPDFDGRLVPSLESVGSLLLDGYPATDLADFSAILVTRRLNVLREENMTSLNGLLHDGELEDGVQLFNVPVLTDLGGLRGIYSAGSVSVTYASSLSSLDGFQDLETVTDGLILTDNPQLLNLDGLESLMNLGGAVQIRNNAELQSIDPLLGLSSIGPDPDGRPPEVFITDNPKLPECAAQEVVPLVDSSAGYVVTGGNDETATCK